MIKGIKNTFPIIIVLCISFGTMFNAKAQEKVDIMEGTVSYITGKNVYVKFMNTNGIENGDTLFMNENEVLIPVLVVQHHSSISCLCNPVGDNTFQISDKMIAKIRTKQKAEIVEIQAENQMEKDVSEQVISTVSEKEPKITTDKQDVYGTLSVSSYSNFSNTESDNLHRFRYTFSMDAHNIIKFKTFGRNIYFVFA